MLRREIVEMLTICLLGEKTSAVTTDVLLYLIESGPVVGTRELIKQVGRWPNAVVQSLRELEEAGIVRVRVDGRRPGPGRKPRIYSVDFQRLARALEECGTLLLRAGAELRGMARPRALWEERRELELQYGP